MKEKKLKRQNVQEQLAKKKASILNEARYWREHGIPKPLEAFLNGKGIEISKSIMLDYEQDYPGISTDEGIVLTAEGIFYEFSVDLNPDRTELLEIDSFIDISDRFDIDGQKKGVGKTYGFLALEVLQELNQ
jgi:hypothetical protein